MKKINIFFNNNFFSKKNNALLTVVGVGPGDPNYLTMAAIKAIRKSKVVFYPVSGFDTESFSLKIVKKYLRFKKKIPIIFPMGRKDHKSVLDDINQKTPFTIQSEKFTQTNKQQVINFGTQPLLLETSDISLITNKILQLIEKESIRKLQILQILLLILRTIIILFVVFMIHLPNHSTPI